MARLALVLILLVALALALSAVLRGAERLALAVSDREEGNSMPKTLSKIAYVLLIVLLFTAAARGL